MPVHFTECIKICIGRDIFEQFHSRINGECSIAAVR